LTAKPAINLWASIKRIDFTGLFDNPRLRFDPCFESSDEPADDFEGIEIEDRVFGFFIFAHIWFTPFQMWLPDADQR
jgi:hypothetical protein